MLNARTLVLLYSGHLVQKLPESSIRWSGDPNGCQAKPHSRVDVIFNSKKPGLVMISDQDTGQDEGNLPARGSVSQNGGPLVAW